MLRSYVHKLICDSSLPTTSSLTDEVGYLSGNPDGHGQIILHWRGTCPELPAVLTH